LLETRSTECGGVVLANVGRIRLGRTETQITDSVWLGESVREQSRTTVNYGRWLREGDTAELVRAVGRRSNKRALIKRNGGTAGERGDS
jgi:hypothetical protein